jgi:DNA-directed RNA polymerase subunit RPC12/RpoP
MMDEKTAMSLLNRDSCSICNKRFRDVTVALVGETLNGDPAIACPKCHAKIKQMWGHTIYFTSDSKSPMKDLCRRDGYYVQ